MNDLYSASPDWLAGTIGMLVLALASGFFSASETALFYLSRDELRAFGLGRPRERVVAALLRDPDRLLTAVLFWNLIINLTYFAVSLVVTQMLAAKGQTALAGLFPFVGLIGLIVLGEVLPKSIAVVFRRSLASLVGRPLALSVAALDPVTPALRILPRIIRRAFWPNLTREAYLHTDDLERAVNLSAQSEHVIRLERDILHNILDLTEITVEEVMRPRGTYLTFETPVGLADLQGRVPPSDYLLLTETGSEQIEATVPLAEFSSVPARHLERTAEEVVHLPWCATVAFALQQMRERLISVAAVVNEYGETIGILTYEDVLDTILLPEASRTRRVLGREPVLEVAPGRYHVEGMTTLRYLARRLGFEDYDAERDPQVTVAGLLHEELERLPVVGDECNWLGCRIRVIDALQRGRLRAMVSCETNSEGPERPVEEIP